MAETKITITDINAVLGILFGITGMTLGLMSYFKDRPKVVVNLKWDMKIIGDPNRKPDEFVGMVTVANVGRRPIYLSHVALKLPKCAGHGYMILQEGISGNKLAEGDPPKIFTINHSEMVKGLQEEIKKQPGLWKHIRAQVTDSASKNYLSNRVKEKPSWAK
jgi:hypothetical protein